MIVIFLLIPLSVVIAASFLAAFIWAVRSGQYEDTCTPAMRLLLEERPIRRAEARPDQHGDAEVAEGRKEFPQLESPGPGRIRPSVRRIPAAAATRRLFRSDDGAHELRRPAPPPAIP